MCGGKALSIDGNGGEIFALEEILGSQSNRGAATDNSSSSVHHANQPAADLAQAELETDAAIIEVSSNINLAGAADYPGPPEGPEQDVGGTYGNATLDGSAANSEIDYSQVSNVNLKNLVDLGEPEAQEELERRKGQGAAKEPEVDVIA